MYNRPYSVGPAWAGRTVWVGFDPVEGQWTFQDARGHEIRRQVAGAIEPGVGAWHGGDPSAKGSPCGPASGSMISKDAFSLRLVSRRVAKPTVRINAAKPTVRRHEPCPTGIPTTLHDRHLVQSARSPGQTLQNARRSIPIPCRPSRYNPRLEEDLRHIDRRGMVHA